MCNRYVNRSCDLSLNVLFFVQVSPATEDIKRGQLPEASVEHGVSLAADGNGQGKIVLVL